MPNKERDVVAEANNNFSLKLYPLLKKPNENLFFSPFSIFTALAMAYAGARNLTEKQMADVLEFNTDQEALHSLIKQLTESLLIKIVGEINVANALWVQLDYNLLKKYMFIINRSYNGSVYELDFRKASEACAKINSWVSEQTRNKISNIINKDMIQNDTLLILINTIYFKCRWGSVFSERATRDAEFTLISGEKISVPMMYQKNRYNYLEEESFRAISINYKTFRFSMLVFLPKEVDGLAELEEGLNKINIEDIYSRLLKRRIELYIPKFKIETKYQLKPHFKSLGMANAFTNDADFSGITDHPDGLKIDEVIHKTFLEVNETGTEAAAATMMTMLAGSSMPPPEPPIKFRVDHPFIFLIYDSESKCILFIGRNMNPSQ